MENISYNTKMADSIISLPTDKNQPTPHELEIVNALFNDKNNKKNMSLILSEAKESLIVGILFLLFSLPQLDKLLNKFLPITEKSVYILFLIKIFSVMILFWLIKHFYLATK